MLRLSLKTRANLAANYDRRQFSYRVDGPKTFTVRKATFANAEYNRQLRGVPYSTRRKNVFLAIWNYINTKLASFKRYTARRRAINKALGK